MIGKMTVSMIAAAGENNTIGINDDLPWHLPKDMKFFKNTTLNHHIIMGRKTWAIFGKPLPKRTSVVITRQENYQAEGAVVTNSILQALQIAASSGEEEAFVIGGGEIYKQALPTADRIYLTRVHGTFEGDTHFPELPESDWEIVQADRHAADERHNYDFTIYVYERIKKG